MVTFYKFLSLLFLLFILSSCTNPTNNNNFNITVGDKNGGSEAHKELIRNCSPRSKCPHVWKWVDNQAQNSNR